MIEIVTIYTKANNDPATDGEINTEPSMTVADGYVPITTRIRELEAAGQALAEARRNRYHYDQDQPVDPDKAALAPEVAASNMDYDELKAKYQELADYVQTLPTDDRSGASQNPQPATVGETVPDGAGAPETAPNAGNPTGTGE